jgi:hypothetical protein
MLEISIMTDTLGAVFLLITGIVALAVGIILLWNYFANKKIYHLLWAISMLVLFISGLLIILYDFAILNEPIIPVAAALIPMCLAIGITFAMWGNNKFVYLFAVYEVVMLLLLFIVKFLPIENMSSFAVMAVHIPAGLVMFFTPIYAFMQKEVEITGLLFSVGAFFIGVGGMLLAFVAINSPILSQQQIFEILPLVLLLTGIFIVLGIYFPKKWSFELKPTT